jgi:hypothetical protein
MKADKKVIKTVLIDNDTHIQLKKYCEATGMKLNYLANKVLSEWAYGANDDIRKMEVIK